MEVITGRTPVDYTRPTHEVGYHYQLPCVCTKLLPSHCGNAKSLLLSLPSGEPGGVAEAHGRGAEGGGGAGPEAAGAAPVQGAEAGSPRRAPVRRPGRQPETHHAACGSYARRRPDSQRRTPEPM